MADKTCNSSVDLEIRIIEIKKLIAFQLLINYILSGKPTIQINQWFFMRLNSPYHVRHTVASELKDPICHSDECQIGSFSSEATTQ